MNDLVIVDTDVLIDAGREIREAVTCLRQIEQKASLAISVITQMELVVGCRNKSELRVVEHFLSRFQVIKLDERISDGAVDLLGRYRLSHGLLIADALIAATALALDQPFVTRTEPTIASSQGCVCCLTRSHSAPSHAGWTHPAAGPSRTSA